MRTKGLVFVTHYTGDRMVVLELGTACENKGPCICDTLYR